MTTATEEKPQVKQEAPKTRLVSIRCNAKRYTYWIENPQIISNGPSGPVHSEGLVIQAQNHLIKLELPKDQKIYDALKSSPRFGIDFTELGNDSSEVTNAGNFMQVLSGMDESEIKMKFTREELDSLGLDLNATKWQLIAAFVKLNKKI
jgi:hypothetical protein